MPPFPVKGLVPYYESLRDWLYQALNADGTLKDSAINLGATTINSRIARTDPGGTGTLGQYLSVGSNGPLYATPTMIDAGHPRWGLVFDGATDNSTALANLAAAVPDFSTLFFPPGRLRFQSWRLDKNLTIQGSGAHAARFGLYGLSVAGSAYGTGLRERGTIFECLATTGAAFDAEPTAGRSHTIALRNLVIAGVGDGTRTTIGLSLGHLDVAKTGVLYRLDNVHFANFKQGMRLRNVLFATGTHLNFVGCETAIALENQSNANSFIGTTIEVCGRTGGGAALSLSNSNVNLFAGGTIEACAGVPLLLSNFSEENTFTTLYLENHDSAGALSDYGDTPTHGIHVASGDNNIFDSMHVGGTGNGKRTIVDGARNVFRGGGKYNGPVVFNGLKNIWDTPIPPTGGLTTNWPELARLARVPTNLSFSNSPYAPTLYDDTLWCNTGGGSITVNLPPVAQSFGRELAIIKIASANSLVIDGNGAEPIDSTTLYTITAQHEGRVLVCDGTRWRTRSRTFV